MSLDALLAAASGGLGAAIPEGALPSGGRYDELGQVLAKRNVFFAFAQALHVFPLGSAVAGPDLLDEQGDSRGDLLRLAGLRIPRVDSIAKDGELTAEDVLRLLAEVDLELVLDMYTCDEDHDGDAEPTPHG